MLIKMNKKSRKKLLAATVAAAAMAVVDALILEKYFFEVKSFDIGATGSAEQIRILLLTDLHFKKFLDPSYKKLAKKINSINPDLILICGDIIDEDGFYAPAKEFFNLVARSIPKIAILGNHDHKSRVRLKTFRQLFDQSNCKLLVNESVKVVIRGKSLLVTGVDDFIEGNPSFAKAVEGVGREDNHLLLIHSPLQQEQILPELERMNFGKSEKDKINIQYIFAGHNHGGQLCLFGFAPILPKMSGNYLKGWYNQKPPYLYLSRGFGTSTLPFRFGARSEITLFNFGV